MFTLKETSVVRKHRKKPNILRRKPKISSKKTMKAVEQPINTTVKDQQSLEIYINSGIEELILPSQQNTSNLSDDSNIIEMKMESSNAELFDQFELSDNNGPEPQSLLNVESFLINGDIKETSTLSNTENSMLDSEPETEDKTKWCLNFFEGSHIEILNVASEDKSFVSTEQNGAAVPLTMVSTNNDAIEPQDAGKPSQNVTDLFHSKVTKIKCDMPNCNKGFWTEAKLQKHKSTHKKKSNNPVSVVCPVSKTGEDGSEVKCGRTFGVRDELLKHLNDDHTLEDAAYRCSRCDRRFFWAVGMRTHEQGSCMRAYACTWPGCGRVFRQPCRLREHARVHTGDRPYPCHYPNCGWSFRSASKLMRHARRHTGERRHECAACGRAFLRREHLREHAARHLAVRAARPACPHAGCDLTFGNMDGLWLHIRQKHRKEGDKPPKKPRTYKPKKDKNVIVVTLEKGREAESPPTPVTSDTNIAAITMATSASSGHGEVVELKISEEVSPGVVDDMEEEGRAARTHCTWPLQPAPASSPPLSLQYHIEDDSQAGQADGSGRNIFTVRSDLFLHGNVLINEDSEFTICRSRRSSPHHELHSPLEARGAASGAPSGAPSGAASGLVDCGHPTVGLMQEELMYADAGVDETSFRVFLLNGEELT